MKKKLFLYFFICIFACALYFKNTVIYAVEKISDYRGNKNKPDVSVLMPTYNRFELLPRSIDSILNQDYKNFEFIIVDDGSTDKSWFLLLKYFIKDKRIRIYFNRENKGRSYSRNRLIDLSQSEYLVIMDSDDYSFPKRIKIQYEYMEKNPDVDVAFGWTKVDGYNDANGYYFNADTNASMVNLLFTIPFSHPSMILRKKSLQKYDIRYNEEEFKNVDDYELFYNLFVNKSKFAVIPFYVVSVRIHRTHSKKFYENRDKDYFDVRKKFQKIFNIDENLYNADDCTKLKQILKANKKLNLLQPEAIKRGIKAQCKNLK